jgi:hypothetical protein
VVVVVVNCGAVVPVGIGVEDDWDWDWDCASAASKSMLKYIAKSLQMVFWFWIVGGTGWTWDAATYLISAWRFCSFSVARWTARVYSVCDCVGAYVHA